MIRLHVLSCIFHFHLHDSKITKNALIIFWCKEISCMSVNFAKVSSQYYGEFPALQRTAFSHVLFTCTFLFSRYFG